MLQKPTATLHKNKEDEFKNLYSYLDLEFRKHRYLKAADKVKACMELVGFTATFNKQSRAPKGTACVALISCAMVFGRL